ncbi:MAG: OmpA family protein, partial [Bacteroidota bacterium]
ATDDTESVETTDLTIDDLTTDKKGKMDKMGPEGDKSGTMLEFGIRPSYTFISGDVDAAGGFGVGAHFRKSLDHLFSLRLDGFYGSTAGDNGLTSNIINRRYESRMIAATGLVVVTLNNFRYSGDTRKTNFYAMVGGGANFFKTDAQRNQEYEGEDNGFPFDEDVFTDGNRNFNVESEFSSHAAAGGGITFRVSPKFNVGLEYMALIPFGNRADLLDGYNSGGNFRDVQNIGSISLNFNLGNASKKAEPDYWTNAFTLMRKDLDKINSRVDDATKDSDGDGVVDAVDQEADTPAGVPVDTRGRVLDSDKDGVPDYQDLEPFFPPRAGEKVNSNGVVINRNDAPITEDRVQEMIDASLARMQAGNEKATTTVVTDRGELFLPMIYFPLGQSTVKYSDYGTLSSVARVLQGSPGMRMVIRGYTDRVGNAANNQVLSYRRAKSVIDHLVNQHGIDRSRLILQFRGEENAIVPLDKSYINRRVEFLTAEAGASEDPAPAGAGGRGGY